MAKQQVLHCSFCGRRRDEVQILIAGQDGHICENCVEHAQDILKQEFPALSENKNSQTSNTKLVVKKTGGN